MLGSPASLTTTFDYIPVLSLNSSWRLPPLPLLAYSVPADTPPSTRMDVSIHLSFALIIEYARRGQEA
jgi:hypothetical protein